MISMLTDVVEAEDGTGKNARIVDFTVAGKTGTSQKFDFSSRRYSSERVSTSFLGFLPAYNARVAILVTLDEPQRDKWGGVAAAPVFKNIGEQILRCYDSRPGEGQIIVEQDDYIPDSKIKLVRSEAMPVFVRALTESARDDAVIPDFKGMTLKKALKLPKRKG
jgi:cell division protein FtsI (penicillin-binding protein 3)